MTIPNCSLEGIKYNCHSLNNYRIHSLYKQETYQLSEKSHMQERININLDSRESRLNKWPFTVIELKALKMKLHFNLSYSVLKPAAKLGNAMKLTQCHSASRIPSLTSPNLSIY